jgi:hypothetical protein
VETVREGLLVLDSDLTIRFANRFPARRSKSSLPPMSKLVSPSMPRCSNSLSQSRIVSSFNNNALATC